jgi:hypothetical protein
VKKKSKSTIKLMSQASLKESKFLKMLIASPMDLRGFEDRVLELEGKLRSLVFGLAYDMDTGKTLKREKTSKNLVDALCNYEKYVKGIIHEQLDPIGLLKEIIERDAPFLVCNDEYILGVKRDRSGLSLPQKNKIAFQVAAQILWFLEKNKIPTIEAMEIRLRDKKNPLYDLLEIKKFRKRTVQDWVGDVFPIPKHSRKGRPVKSGVSENKFNKRIPIPEVILGKGKIINFLKLRFVIMCFSVFLRALNWSKDQIEKSVFIQAYKPHLKFYLWMYIKCWICRAVEKNSSIFDA